MVSFVTFLWNNGYRNYKPEHVNILANALAYWHKEPHRVICITDETKGFNDKVEVYPIPKEAERLGHLTAPQGKSFPSSYRRMWLFSEEAKDLGDQIMLLDIDCMISGDLAPLVNHTDADFVGWRPDSIWGKEGRIGGGTWLHKTGTLAWLWEAFIDNPAKMITETRSEGWNGSDQAILSRYLAHKYPIWPKRSGIYSTQDGVFHWDLPPKDAKIIHFNGDSKPWNQNKLWMKAYCNHFRK